MADMSYWLTGIRLERLSLALKEIPHSIASPLDYRSCISRVWNMVGGPLDEIAMLIDGLIYLNLAIRNEDSIRLTRTGDKIAKEISKGNYNPFGITLIRAGLFHQQARMLIEVGKLDSDGNLICNLGKAKCSAPQLVYIFQWWPEIIRRPILKVPASLLTELNSVWALLPPPIELPQWLAERKAVGNRAEMYSYQYERSQSANPSGIIWVAKDSDTLGWDIEDQTSNPYRCIEVKGRRNEDLSFFLSANEMLKARELATYYEVHFWGGINLNREPATEYASLRALGYPIVIKEIATLELDPAWFVEPTQWKLTWKNSLSSDE